MNLYLVLLRPHQGTVRTRFSLDRHGFAHLLRRTGVRVFDLYNVAANFQAMLVCQAPGNDAMRKLLEELVGWETTSVLVGDHVGRFGSDEVSTGITVHGSHPKISAQQIVSDVDRLSLRQMLAFIKDHDRS
jgi:hypothetical protein